jgi:hypothetical protein
MLAQAVGCLPRGTVSLASRSAPTCQTRGMRIFASALRLVSWRLRLGLSGMRLRFRGVLSALIVLGGAGAAVGYAIAERVLSDQGESETRKDA